jgi:predicted transcriptional regulator
MTGRDLIMYILANGLENEPVFKNGKFIGFVTTTDVAKKSNVGLATVHAWMQQGRLESVAVNEGIYIPANFKSPMEKLSV